MCLISSDISVAPFFPHYFSIATRLYDDAWGNEHRVFTAHQQYPPGHGSSALNPTIIRPLCDKKGLFDPGFLQPARRIIDTWPPCKSYTIVELLY